MKTTRYFNHSRSRPDRQEIRDEWSAGIRDPVEEEIQADGRILPWTTQRQQHSSYIQPDLPLERVHFFGKGDALAVGQAPRRETLDKQEFRMVAPWSTEPP